MASTRIYAWNAFKWHYFRWFLSSCFDCFRINEWKKGECHAYLFIINKGKWNIVRSLFACSFCQFFFKKYLLNFMKHQKVTFCWGFPVSNPLTNYEIDFFCFLLSWTDDGWNETVETLRNDCAMCLCKQQFLRIRGSTGAKQNAHIHSLALNVTKITHTQTHTHTLFKWFSKAFNFHFRIIFCLLHV